MLKSQTPIVPVFIGDTALATEMSKRLLDKGTYVHRIGIPYVPEGTARLRTIISASHTEEDLSEEVYLKPAYKKDKISFKDFP